MTENWEALYNERTKMFDEVVEEAGEAKDRIAELEAENAGLKALLTEKQSHINKLDERVKSQRHEIRVNTELIKRKNVELDALHFVWCSGPCDSGDHRFVPGSITEETVEMAERNTKRLRERFEVLKRKAGRVAAMRGEAEG